MKGNSLIVSAASNWTSIAISLAVTFLLTPFIISHIGTAGYGIWVLVLSVVGYYGLLDLGLHSATIRYVARYVGKGDREALGRTVSTAIVFFFGIGALVLGSCFFIVDPLVSFFKVSEKEIVPFRNMVWLIGAAAGIGFPRRVFDAILMAHEKFVLLNGMEICFSLARALAIFLLLSAGMGLEGIGLAELGVEAANFSGKLILMIGIRREIGFSFFRVSRKTTWALFGFGLLTFITLIGDSLRFNIDSAVIGHFIGLEAVGVYGIAFTLIRVLIRASNASTVVTFPRLSQLAGKSTDLFRTSYVRYSRACAAFIGGLALGLVILSPGFIRLWVGDAYREAGAVILVLGGALCFDYMTTVSVNALKALNRMRFYAAQTVIEGILKLALAVVLVQHWGLMGVAWGTAVPMVLSKVVVQPVYTSRVVGIGWWTYFREALVKPVLTASVLGVLFHFSGLLANPSYIELAAGAIALAAAYSAAAYFFILRRDERTEIRTWLVQSMRGLSRRMSAPAAKSVKEPD